MRATLQHASAHPSGLCTACMWLGVCCCLVMTLHQAHSAFDCSDPHQLSMLFQQVACRAPAKATSAVRHKLIQPLRFYLHAWIPADSEPIIDRSLFSNDPRRIDGSDCYVDAGALPYNFLMAYADVSPYFPPGMVCMTAGEGVGRAYGQSLAIL